MKNKLEIHIKTRVQTTCFANVKMPHRSLVFKTRVLCKKKFIYSGVFKPYSDVFKPYSGVFLQFMKIESLKLDFHADFFQHRTHPLTNRDLKTRVLS